jgi:sporulation protein YlmC with PRC-barrel domain
MLGGDSMSDEKVRSRKLIGKILISEETGKKFGTIGDIDYVTESGELLNLVLTETTTHSTSMNLPQDERKRFLIPFSAVKSVGDFVIVSEREIM